MDPQIDIKVIWYSLLFAGCYTVCNVGLINALKTGPMVLTALFMQLSLIGVTVWSFIFWNTKFSLLVSLGLLLVVIALWLCLWTGKSPKEKLQVRWIVYILMAFVGNAGCSIVQKNQQMKFDGNYGGFLMLVATGISLLVCLASFLYSSRKNVKDHLNATCLFPIAAGLCNGLLNLFVIFLATSDLSPSLIYPVLAIGGLVLTTVFSAFVFKEKMHWWQWIGVFIGVMSVGVLSI